MGSLYNFNTNELLAFALILLRLIGFFVSMPIIGSVTVPTSSKVLLSLTVSMIIFPQVGWAKLTSSLEHLDIITLAIKEMFIGLSFGFLARLFFMAVTMAGEVTSISMGVSSAQLFNPTMGVSSTALDQFYVTIASLFFFSINGHHVLISGIYKTFELVPITKTSLSLTGLQEFGAVTQNIMSIAVKMSAPILVTILFTNVAIAIVGRAVPQINILITSLPVNILVGFAVVIVGMPLLVLEMNSLLGISTAELFEFIKTF